MDFFVISLLNSLSYGLLLFMLSAGLTLILSMMGVLNFAHASFYMLGAYVGFSLNGWWGFWPALLLAPLLVGLLGAAFECLALRKVQAQGHVAELLMTFGVSFVLLELVQLVWGRVPLSFDTPQALQGTAFTISRDLSSGWHLQWGGGCASGCAAFPLSRAFMGLVSLGMLAVLGGLLHGSRLGLVIQAAQSHPQMVQALGHDVPRVLTLVFGVGTGLAALAGVMGGSVFVTEPGMAATVGSIIFVVVVVGGLGSLAGAFLASLLIGAVQTFTVAYAPAWGAFAPSLPFLGMVAMLVLRPQGLMGHRAG